ncbi:hypothetical protein HOD83_02625 [Candidatus Woesearchaeota archaeon]|jgi:hypothetical protein|nr:hypothetical protein [Candidatus Woesearchaeota archaeon]MBT4114318.1 hypothetical protein [Candidatus Woesearchaeota archaeon]MBT4248462.1 hypothetical protein [Candidatus Woesearchaeota archaeon]
MAVKIISRTIEDTITRDGLKALPETLVTVGGMAIQLYAQNLGYTNFRSTSDIDTETHERMSFTEFVDRIAVPIMDQLPNYSIIPRKRRKAFELKVISEAGEELLIHGNRHSQKEYALKADIRNRELDNTHYIQIDGAPIKLVAPEDIIVTKLDRIIKNVMRYALIPEHKNVTQLNTDRIQLFESFDNAEAEDIIHLQLNKDAHDLALISKKDIDPDYLFEAKKDWPELKRLNDTSPLVRKVAAFIPQKISEALS